MPGKKFSKLLENEDLKRWYDSTSRGSQITADVNLRRLGSFCDHVATSPNDLIKMDSKALTDLIDDFVTEMERKDFAPNYIHSILKGVKSWLAHNNRKLIRKIKIKNSGKARTLRNERVPTQDELKLVFASGDARSRAAVSIMAHSGVRPEVLGNYLGNDGLKVADFPELEILDGHIEIKKIPTVVIVRDELSKAGNEYFTFLGYEGCYFLKAYLEERIRTGENINSESPVIAPIRVDFRGHFIRTINIGDVIRQPIRKAGFDWRPYVMRGYFDSQLLTAESKGLIIRDYRTFFMGHKGGIEGTYTTSKKQNPESIENMRESYSKALKFLETESKGISEEDHTRQLREHSLMTLKILSGVELDDEEKENLLSLEESEFWRQISEMFKDKKAQDLNNGNKFKTIPERDLDTHLNSGWELVQIYPNGDKAVIKLP